MDIAILLTNSFSADRALRDNATQQLEQLARENFGSYAFLLVQQLANEQIEDTIRMAAGLALKNSLTAKDYIRKEENAQRWCATDEAIRAQIKQGALLSLNTPKRIVGNTAAQVIAAIAEIELVLNRWPDLIRVLLEGITATDNVVLKISTLRTIGYVCESTSSVMLRNQSDEILSAIVEGARKEEQNPDVRLAALHALYNSLEFIKSNFEREGERNFILQVVCESTQSSSVAIQEKAFECLVKIMQLYYDKMQLYVEKALFGLTVAGMNSPDQKVALQAIEFWSTVCEEEIERKEEAYEATEMEQAPVQILYNFAELAMKDVLPVLLWLLTKQEEDDDEDEWNVSMAASICLGLFAHCVRNAVIAPIVPFIESNIQNPDWRYRDAAVMAFGSILDGPEELILMPLVNQALPVLITMMADPVVRVKDTVAWTLGRVCEVLIGCIKPDLNLRELVSALVMGLQDNPRIVGNCCWALINLAEHLGSPTAANAATTTPLSIYFEDTVKSLLIFTEVSDNEAQSRTSAYEAVSSLVSYSADDCVPTVQNIVITVLDRLHASIAAENQILSIDDREELNELQSSLLGNCIRRLSKNMISVSDPIMTLLLQLLRNPSKHTAAMDDGFLAVGAMMTALESNFGRYIDPFMPLLVNALQNSAEHQLCSIAVGLVGDLCRALGGGIAPYSDTFMQLLVSNLQSPMLHRDVKPGILSCFGDMASAIGEKFESYLEVVMAVLMQAGCMRPGVESYDMADYVNTLHEGVIEAYVGIVQGFDGAQKLSVLVPYIDGIFAFLRTTASDPMRSDALSKAMLGLLGDLADAFGGQLEQFLTDNWVALFINEVRTSKHYTASTKNTARWAKEMIKFALL